jgi:hypothetical protein
VAPNAQNEIANEDRAILLSLLPLFETESGYIPPAPWKLSGTWRPLLWLSRDWVLLDPNAKIQSDDEQCVDVESVVPLSSLEITISDNESFFEAQLIEKSKTQYSLQLKPQRELTDSSRVFSSHVFFVAHLESGEKVTVSGISVEGRTNASVIASPDRINFGLLDVGAEASERIVIQSITKDPIHIESTISNHNDATVHIVEGQLEPRTIALSLKAQMAGTRVFDISVIGRQSDGRPFSIQVPVRYVGNELAVDSE